MKKVTSLALLEALPIGVQEFYAHEVLKKFFPGPDYALGEVPTVHEIVNAIYDVAQPNNTLQIERMVLKQCFETVLDVTRGKSLKVKNGVHPISHTLLCFALIWQNEPPKDKDVLKAIVFKDYLNYETAGQATKHVQSMCGKEVALLANALKHVEDSEKRVMSTKTPTTLVSMAITKLARLISDIGHLGDITKVPASRIKEYNDVMAAIELQYDTLSLNVTQEWLTNRLKNVISVFNTLCQEPVKEEVGKVKEEEAVTV